MCKYRPNWHVVRSEGKIYSFATSQIRTLALDVCSTTEVEICMYQSTSRCTARCLNLVNIAVLVLHCPRTDQLGLDSRSFPFPTACTLESGCCINPLVTTSGVLAPGTYVILPLAFSHYQHPPGTEKRREKETESSAVPYVVSVFSEQKLAFTNVITSPGFLPESLFLLARKIGRVKQVISRSADLFL